MNALIIYLNNHSHLLPYVSKSNKKYLSPTFADDLNIFTSSLDTVRHIFRILDDFKSVSGLKVNLDKTNGLFFNKTGSVTFNQLPLPLANWNRDIKILGIPYGSNQYLHYFWQSICEDVQISLNRYNNTYSTFDAKSIITKSLILPLR